MQKSVRFAVRRTSRRSLEITLSTLFSKMPKWFENATSFQSQCPLVSRGSWHTLSLACCQICCQSLSMSMIAMDAFLRQARAGGDGGAGHAPPRLKRAPKDFCNRFLGE